MILSQNKIYKAIIYLSKKYIHGLITRPVVDYIGFEELYHHKFYTIIS